MKNNFLGLFGLRKCSRFSFSITKMSLYFHFVFYLKQLYITENKKNKKRVCIQYLLCKLLKIANKVKKKIVFFKLKVKKMKY